MRHHRPILALLLCAAGHAIAQVITTIAGTAFTFPSQPLPAINAPLGNIFSVATDAQNNLYVADFDNNLVLRISPDGTSTVVAGNGTYGFSGDGGPATSASLSAPSGIAVDSAGNLYIADYFNNRIRKVSRGIITTVAGDGTQGFSGDNGPATSASFSPFAPWGIAVDPAGNLYIADTFNNRIRKVSGGIITTVAGNAEQGSSGDGGPATSAFLFSPQGVATDSAGNLYIADTGNGRIRKVSSGVISTFAGGGFSDNGGPATSVFLSLPVGVAAGAAGTIYIVDVGNHQILKVSSGIISTAAGTRIQGFSGDGGLATAARLASPEGAAADSSGNLYIADTLNHRVRKVSVGLIGTVAGNGNFKFSGDGGPATSAALNGASGVAVDSAGNVYAADVGNQRVRKVSGGIITTVAGNGISGYSGDQGSAAGAELFFPSAVAVDSAGNIYIADTLNSRIRKVSGGIITTVAGNGDLSFSGDNGPATSVALAYPAAIAVDSAGNIYFSDTGSRRVRKVTSGIISTIAGNGSSTYSGDGGQATATGLDPNGLTVDSAGNIYIADTKNNRIRKVSGGIITTVAGNGVTNFSGDGGPATSASLNSPADVAVDSAGNIYIADTGNNRVRKVAGGIITTFAGNGVQAFGDGDIALRATLNAPGGLAVDAAGNLYIADSGNDRIRKVLPVANSFQAAPASLNFTATAGGPHAAAQTFRLTPTLAGLPFSAAASTNWLIVTPSSGAMPSSLQVIADPATLSAGAYTGQITITAPGASPSTRIVSVTFAVSAPITGNLGLSAASLAFSFTQGASPDSQQLTISNLGSGSLRYTVNASVTTGGSWLSVSGPASGLVTPASPALINVIVTPGNLTPGSYSGTITVASPDSGQQLTLPVTLAISAPPQKILLSQVGFTFTAVAQGGTVLPQSLGILNTGSGTLNYSAQASTLPGASGWLKVSSNNGTVVRPFLDVSFVDVSVDARSLARGTYYGQITVQATGASNSPQTAVVVLTVLPPGSNPGPVVRPTGLIFTGVTGAESPGSQDVTVANITANPTTFGSSIAYVGTGGSIKYHPTDFTVTPSAPARIVVQPDFSKLTSGPHRAALTLAFDDGSNPVISILAVLAPAGTSPRASPKGDRLAESCVPSKLLPQITQVGFGPVTTVSYPAVISVKVVDDCGQPMTDGSVVASFSNGDAPLSLNSLQDGNWTNSWQPGRPASSVTINADVRQPSLNITGSAPSVTVGLQAASQSPPVLSSSPGGLGTPTGSAFAPGDVMLLKGIGLANGPASSSAAPLKLQLAGASVYIGGSTASLLYADTVQVLALVPPELPLNTSQQVLVQRDNALGIAVPVIIAATHPAVLTKDGSGQGQGLVYTAAKLADTTNPAKSGDTIIVYCTGLGATEATGKASNTPQLTIGGQPAQVSYAGIALAANYPATGPPTVLGGLGQIGLAGLYQITATVPAGLFSGPAQILISSAGQTSPPGVTLTVTGAAPVGPSITSMNTAYGSSDIAQNDFIEIHGANLSRATAGPAALTTQLGGATVTVNGKPALLYYVSPTQINALTPLDSATGRVAVTVNNGASTASFTANLRTVTPAFLRFDASGHITATHADGSYLGPTSLGDAFTPAKPGDTIVAYAVGFGLPSTPLVNGSASQSGPLPTLPDCQISGAPAPVTFAGLNGFAGLYQLNLVVPSGASAGDNPVSCTYNGQSTPTGAVLAIR